MKTKINKDISKIEKCILSSTTKSHLNSCLTMLKIYRQKYTDKNLDFFEGHSYLIGLLNGMLKKITDKSSYLY